MGHIVVRRYNTTSKIKAWLAIRLIWLAACLIDAEVQVSR